MADPVDNSWSNSMLGATGGNTGCINVSNFSDWDPGEANSLPNAHSNVHGTTPEVEHSWGSSSRNYVAADPRSEEREFDYANGILYENCSNAYGVSHPIGRTAVQQSSSNTTHLENVHLVGLYHNFSGPQISRTFSPLGLNKAVGSGTELIPPFASSDNGGTSSYNSGDSSSSGWGFTCKRKALEVSPVKSFTCGSSSSNPQTENIAQHNVPSYYNPSSNLSLSVPSNAGVLEEANSRNASGSRLSAGNEFQSSSGHRITEGSTRNFDGIENMGNMESVSFGIPLGRAALGPSDIGPEYVPPVHFSSNFWQPLSLSMNSNNPADQSPPMASTTHQRSPHSVPWNGSPYSQGGRSSTINSRHFSATETRNLALDADNWNPAIMSYSPNQPSGSGIGYTSQRFPTVWNTNQNPTTRSHQRLSEVAPWTLSPPAASEPGSQGGGGHFLVPPWAPTSSNGSLSPPWASTSTEELLMSSQPRRRGNHQPYLGPSMDNRGTLHALASDFEGRNRVASEIRQVLNAMRRYENFQAEDHMAFNPFINEVGELHDRHRDMRLDVDNMSYEELLALEEHIGNVNTGLSEATILESMKQRKYEYNFFSRLSSDLEPCCICQEEYVTADDIGTLDCGHEFHTNCIKQWLMLKNLCPICKMTGLET